MKNRKKKWEYVDEKEKFLSKGMPFQFITKVTKGKMSLLGAISKAILEITFIDFRADRGLQDQNFLYHTEHSHIPQNLLTRDAFSDL